VSKVASLREAVAIVADGSTLALGGFAITGCVIAAVHEIVRAGRRDLTVVQVVGGMDTDVLVGAGCVAALHYSGGSLDRFGVLNGVHAAIGSGRLRAVEYSSLSLALRLHAGAVGLAHVASRSMLGSDLLGGLLDSGDARLADDPFTGSPVVLLPPIRPDVAVIHVTRADERGNATIQGPRWTSRETAFASRAVVLTCEELVPHRAISPDLVTIPGAIVTAVVPVPRGAHPTALHGCYDFDRAHLEEYVGHARRGAAGMAEYLDRYVRGVPDHAAYLRLVAS
jgi:glutaconate CoA-transferase, subunit A